jgi:hypothetical protein
VADAGEPGLSTVTTGIVRHVILRRGLALGAFGLGASSAALAQDARATAPPSQTYKGLEISVVALERASSAALSDCPPGANTQRAMARPGEQFAIVTVNVKVLPSYTPTTTLKRPLVTDRAGKTYNTAATFVDLGKMPVFSCVFPFRVPDHTELKSIQIDALLFDLRSLDR